MTYIYHYASPLGRMTAASNGTALTGLWFDGQTHFGSTLPREREEKMLPVFTETMQWLDTYFSGKPPSFTPPLCMETTPFRKVVWEILLTIPFGQTMCYGEIAEHLAAHSQSHSMSAQAVGNAVGHNAFALIVPCHRVIGKTGNLTGYAGGIHRKIQLLRLENVDTSSFYVPPKGH